MKDMRYQVMADKTPKGLPYHKIFNYQFKRDANKKEKELKKKGYKNVQIWDTRQNSLSNLLSF